MTHAAQPPDTNTPTDAAAIADQIREHQFLQQKLREEIASLGGALTDQWAGMGPDQVLVLADTLDELVGKLKPGKSDHRTVVVEYLSSEPPVLVL